MGGLSFGACNGLFRRVWVGAGNLGCGPVGPAPRRPVLAGGARRWAFRFALALALGVSVAGCGGGGGGQDGPSSLDTDRDGIPNGSDSDDDNDGLVDDFDAFPLDPDETVDTDGDGTGDNADADDDNDGVLDGEDAFPLDPDESVDTDGDGIGDNADLDDDNDGEPDQDDLYPLDPESAGEPVQVPDPAVRNAMLAAVGKYRGDTLYAHQVATIRRLDLFDVKRLGYRRGVVSLEGLQFATGLEELIISQNEVSDLGPLAGLTALTEFRAYDNDIVDVTPLAGLSNLRNLNLFGNRIVDVTPLAGLSNLRNLDLFGNRIVDVTPLAGLSNLRNLDLFGNRIADFSPLRNLTELRELDGADNLIADLSWISGMTELEKLNLGWNFITDIRPLSALSKLLSLRIYVNGVVDIAPLAQLSALRSLVIGRNFIEDIGPLTELPNLEWLNLEGSRHIADYAPLSSMSSLKGIDLQNNRAFSDLGILSGLTGLEELVLSGNRKAYDLDRISSLVNLEFLDLEYNQILDLTPLVGFQNLQYLYLRDTGVSDLSPLTGLEALDELDLRSNRIEDIAPLAGNPGLDAGDSVDVRFNPLSPESVDSHVPALAERGVEVAFDAFAARAADGPRIHNGNLFVLPVPGNIATDDSLPLDEFAQRFYAHFEDAFDFLMFISNVVYSERRSVSRRYAGRYYTVANDTRGLGLPDLARHGEFGSAGRLQGVIEFPLAAVSIERGPALHEVMHRWANYVVAPHPHWGFTSAFGQLGGFRAERLTDWGGGRYTAGSFGLAANGGNGVPYSPIELYLAGFIPSGEVPDLLIAEDARWLFEDDGATTRLAIADNGQPIFTATRVSRRSVEDLVAEQGIRTPDHAQSQRAFRAAAILLIDETHPAYADQLDQLSEEVAWFANAGDDGNDDRYNFHEATGGRATMAMGGLSEFNTGTPVPSTPVRISARSARTRDVQDAPDEPRPGRLFQELEGSPRWPQVPDGRFGPAGPHGAWCRHESHAGLRIPSALKATGARGS